MAGQPAIFASKNWGYISISSVVKFCSHLFATIREAHRELTFDWRKKGAILLSVITDKIEIFIFKSVYYDFLLAGQILTY